MDVRSVRVESSAVSLIVILELTFADQIHHVKSEAFDSLSHPETHDVLHFFADIFIVPVKIRLGHVEKMQVVFIEFLHILPGASAKLTLPVGRRLSVFLAFFEEEKVFVVRVALHRFFEPFVTV